MNTPPQEVSQERIDHLYPREPIPWSIGVPLEFEDTGTLHQFEEAMPQYIDKLADLTAWSARPPLDDILRPQRPRPFLGIIRDINLIPESEPAEALLGMSVPILTIEGKKGTRPLTDLNPFIRDRFIGFSLIARACSTGRGQIATIKSVVAYAPCPLSTSGTGKSHYGATYGMRRVLSRPVYSNPDAFEQLVNESIVTSQAVEESDLRHTIVKGFSQ